MKREAIILLGHGSRVPGAGEAMQKVADRLREKYNYPLVDICFLSRLGPHFQEVFEKCVGRGATQVIVIPYFLHTGLHIRLDIPKMMQENAEKFPHVKLIFGRYLGYDESLVDLVEKRIAESKGSDDVRTIDLPGEEQYPVPPGQCEFVPMPPEEAEKWREDTERERGGRNHA